MTVTINPWSGYGEVKEDFVEMTFEGNLSHLKSARMIKCIQGLKT